MTTTPQSTSLHDATVELRKGLAEQLGEENLAVFDKDASELATMNFPNAPGVGDKAPGFRLPDARGGFVELSDLLKTGPAVLVFYRGAWCPYCNLQLVAFQRELDQIRATGANLVAVSPQLPDASLSLSEQHALDFPVLSDAGNTVADSYGLRFIQGDAPSQTQRELGISFQEIYGDDSNTLPAASTFVIDQDGTVQFASISGDYRWRVGPEEVLRVLHG